MPARHSRNTKDVNGQSKGTRGSGGGNIGRRRLGDNGENIWIDEGRINPRKETERSPLAASDSVGMALCRDGVDGPPSSMRL